MGDITVLIEQAETGHTAAVEARSAALCPDLRRLARARLVGHQRHTLLDNTSLVHECFLKPVSSQSLRAGVSRRLPGRARCHGHGRLGPGLRLGQYLSGTSMATAVASGMLARWGAQRLRQAHAEKLMPICKAAQDLGAAGKDPVFGCGMVR